MSVYGNKLCALIFSNQLSLSLLYSKVFMADNSN